MIDDLLALVEHDRTLARDPDVTARRWPGDVYRSETRHSVRLLGALGEVAEKKQRARVTALLLDCLQDDDEQMQWDAGHALRWMMPATTSETIDRLLTRLRHPGHFARRVTAETLGASGPAADGRVIDALTACLGDDDCHVRRAAAEALGWMGPAATRPEAIDAHIALLGDDYTHVRRAAAEALGWMGRAAARSEVINALLAHLEDGNAVVRAVANEVRKLGQMGPGAELNIAAVADREARDFHEEQLSVILTLGRLGQAAGPEPCACIIKTLHTRLNAGEWETRNVAARALGWMGPAAADRR